MYLWIDLWDKRCGLAVFIEPIVVSKWIIPRTKLVSILKKNIIEYEIKTIVIGQPFDLYGKKTRQLDKTNAFILKMKNIFPDINIETQDERFTSFEADISLWNENRNKDFKRDDISAIIILESYLKSKKLI